MTDERCNTSAFPFPIAISPQGSIFSSSFVSESGMALRDWFAGQALPAAMTAAAQLAAGKGPITSSEGIAVFAYSIADAMLHIREVK